MFQSYSSFPDWSNRVLAEIGFSFVGSIGSVGLVGFSGEVLVGFSLCGF